MKTVFKKGETEIKALHDGIQPLLLVHWGRVSFGGTLTSLIDLERMLHEAIMQVMYLDGEGEL